MVVTSESMRVHVFQHVPFEDLGIIVDWLEERGAAVRYTRFFAGDSLPAIGDVDFLIVLGGPMSVNDETELPWLVAEKAFIQEAVAADLPVLGVCLGAQLIASALGARVYPQAVKEIGWFPVDAVDGGGEAMRFPDRFDAFHWHGETFDLPAGAVRLASTEACTNQAFQLGRRVLGLQFHLETTRAAAAAMVQHCRHELVPGPYIQTETELRGAPDACHDTGNTLMRQVLDYLAAP